MHPTQKPAALDGVTPSDCLRGAATYLDRYGWHQGRFFADDSPFPAASADGALIMAVYGRPVDVFDPANAGLLDTPAYELWLATLDAVEDHLGLRRAFIPAQHIIAPGDLLFAWQDDPDRTQEQVVTVLLDAADDDEHDQDELRDAIALSDKHPSEWTDVDIALWLGEDSDWVGQRITYNPETDRYEMPDGTEDPGCRARRLVEESSPAAFWGAG